MSSLYSNRIIWLLGAMLIASLYLSACEDTPRIVFPDDGAEYGLTVTMDTIWVLGSPLKHSIKIRVIPNEIPDGSRIRCQISGSAMFYLYDDGGTGYHDDSIGFADTSSGDSDAGDGIFSRRVSSAFTHSSGIFKFTFSLPDSINTDTAKVDVTVRQNSSPVVLSQVIPDSVYSGSRDSLFSAVIIDPDGITDVVSAELFLTYEHIGFPMNQLNDSTWEWYAEPYLASGLKTDTYQMVIQAFDRAGSSSWSGFGSGESDSCWLENQPPSIWSINGPDTIYIPEAGDELFHYVISVKDDQTVTDLDSLLLIMRDNSGTIRFTSSYLDDGEGIDSTAGDGSYYAGFMISSENQPDNYSFEWIPTDRADQYGSPFITTIVVLRREGMTGIVNPDDAEKIDPDIKSNYYLLK